MEAITDERIVKAVQYLRGKNEQKNSLFAGVLKFNLQFCMFKLPVLPAAVKNSKQIRVVMPHMLPNLDVCLIVADGENRGDRIKIDDTIQFYEDQFRSKGITEIKEIIPLLKMKLEYQTFESKFALATRYNTVLADSRICRFLPPLLGKAFYGKKRFPMQVDLHETGLEERLKRDLRTQLCLLSFKGANNSLLVGEAEMKDEEIIENIRAAIEKIIDVIPGGKENIFNLSLRLHDSEPIPIFISNTDRSTIPIPSLPEHFISEGETLEGEVSTIKGKVTITPDGTVIVTKSDGTTKVIGAKVKEDVPFVNKPILNLRGGKNRRGNRGGVKRLTQGKTKNSLSDKNKQKGRKTPSDKTAKSSESDTSTKESADTPKVGVSTRAEWRNKLRRKRKRAAGASKAVEENSSLPHANESAKKRKLSTPKPKLSGKKSLKSKNAVGSRPVSAIAKTPAKVASDALKTPVRESISSIKVEAKTPDSVSKPPKNQTSAVAKTFSTPSTKPSAAAKTPLAASAKGRKTPTTASKKEAKTPVTASKKEAMTPVTASAKGTKTPATASKKEAKTPVTASAKGTKTPTTAPKKDARTPVIASKNEAKTPVTASAKGTRTPGTASKKVAMTPATASKKVAGTPTKPSNSNVVMKTPKAATENSAIAVKTPGPSSKKVTKTPVVASVEVNKTPKTVSTTPKAAAKTPATATKKTPSKNAGTVNAKTLPKGSNHQNSTTKTPLKTPKSASKVKASKTPLKSPKSSKKMIAAGMG